MRQAAKTAKQQKDDFIAMLVQELRNPTPHPDRPAVRHVAGLVSTLSVEQATLGIMDVIRKRPEECHTESR